MALMCGGGGGGGANLSESEQKANNDFKEVAKEVGKENTKVCWQSRLSACACLALLLGRPMRCPSGRS